jgi:hypothetical protein
VENRNPSDELRKQREREMEVMRLQRQQALEEEEIRQVRHNHGERNYKDTKPYMSSLLVFIRVYRLEIQSVMLVFLTL